VKKIALTLVAAASLGLTACGGGADTNNAATADTNTELTANEASADVNAATSDLGNDLGNGADATGNALSNTGNAIENGAEATGNALGNAANSLDNASVNVTTNAQ
jgi:hypothetical protein